MKEIVASYADTAKPKKVQSSGFYIAGHRYITLKAEERSLYGKKVWNAQRISRRLTANRGVGSARERKELSSLRQIRQSWSPITQNRSSLAQQQIRWSNLEIIWLAWATRREPGDLLFVLLHDNDVNVFYLRRPLRTKDQGDRLSIRIAVPFSTH